MDAVLDDGGPLDDAAHVGSGRLDDVLLNVMDHVLVDLAMDHGLYLDDAVLADGLLDDGGTAKNL